MVKYMGIDGCRGGWFYLGRTREDEWRFGLLPSIEDLKNMASPRTRICLDMPMGLLDRSPEERRCDKLARKCLGKKGASIFPAPCRAALDAPDYATASQVNFEHTGRRLSCQSFNIIPKIREVDRFITTTDVTLKECHPELSFQALNQGNAMAHSKKSPEGREERLVVLSRWIPEIRTLFDQACRGFLRKELALDDILDAAVLAVVAGLGEQGIALPDAAEYDGKGIPMQIIYPDAQAVGRMG